MTKGGRNLVILGIVAAIVALASTSVSLAMYHYSGDIYLDRSRPGYLPDEEEKEEEEETEEGLYEFEKTGLVTKEVLTEYLEKMQVEVDGLKGYEKPFDTNALSDEALGIGK